MSEQNDYPYFNPANGQLTMRVTNDEIKFLNDLFPYVNNSSEYTTFKDFCMNAMVKAHQKIQPVIKAENELKEMKSENLKLKKELEQKLINEQNALKEQNELKKISEQNEIQEQNKIQELNVLIVNKDECISQLETEIENLKNNLRENTENPHVIEKPIEVFKEKQLLENQIIVNFSAIEKGIINHVSNSETKRVNKQITPEYLLKQVFFAQALSGFGDHIHPKSLISKKTLQNIKNNLIPKKDV